MGHIARSCPEPAGTGGSNYGGGGGGYGDRSYNAFGGGGNQKTWYGWPLTPLSFGTHMTWPVATLVVVLGTFLATACRVPSVTIVLDLYALLMPDPPASLTTHSRPRAISVRTAPSLRGALATPVVRKGLCVPFLPFSGC